MNIDLKPKHVGLTLAVIIFGLMSVNLVAVILSTCLGYGTVYGFIELFSMNVEANVPSFYSATALLISALLLGVISLASRKQGDSYFGWLILAVIAFGLAVDEAAVIHEKISYLLETKFQPQGIFFYAWILPYGILTLLIGIIYIPFLKRLPKRTCWLLIASGLLFVGGAIGVESIGGWIDYNTTTDGVTLPYALMFTVEETLEMSGIALLIYTLLAYISETFPDLKIRIKSS